MILKMLGSNRAKAPQVMIVLGMALLAIVVSSQKFLHPSACFGPNLVDFVHGMPFGISAGLVLLGVMLIHRMRRHSGILGLLLCLGVLAYPASAAPAQPGSDTSGSFFTTTDGVRLHYIESGKGPAILFVPGWSMPAWIWEKQIAQFSRNYHVIALDPRDQGESDKVGFGNNTARRARDIEELIAHLKLSPAVLVGWSFGVPEVLSFAEQFGGADIRAYVLVDGFAWDKQNPQLVSGMLAQYQHVQNNREAFTDQFIRGMFRKPQSEEYIRRLENASLRMPTDSAIADSVSVVGRPDWTPAIRKLDRPVLIMCETAMKPLAADLIISIVPSAQVELFPNAGHALFVDDPDHFNSTLQAFMDKLPRVDKKGG